MDVSQNCIFCYKTTHLVISLLLLMLVSSPTHERFLAEGRTTSKLLEVAQRENEEDEKVVMVMRNQIGSSPPRCERRCSSCQHCQAVQVPVIAQTRTRRRSHYLSPVSSSIKTVYSRQDDISNYKPMSWKCKCGNLIFNP